MQPIAGKIKAINVGLPKQVNFRNKPLETAIFKEPIYTPVYLTSLGLEEDGPADLVNHGGADKAVHVYSYDRYPFWEQEWKKPLTFSAFGENLTVSGMREEEVCIGDIYQIGEAVVQVSEARVPCFKVALRNAVEIEDVVPVIHRTGYSGFYFRVLQEGVIGMDDPLIRLVERHASGITLAETNRIRYFDNQNRAALQMLLDLQELSTAWRNWVTRSLASLESL